MEDSDKRFPLLVCNVDWTVLEGIDAKNVDHVLSHVFLANYMIAQDLLEVGKCLQHGSAVEVYMRTVGVHRKKARLSQYCNEQGWKAKEFCTSILVLKLAC